MKKKSENVALAQDGIRPKKLKNSGACGIRHPQAVCCRMRKLVSQFVRQAVFEKHAHSRAQSPSRLLFQIGVKTLRS
jgi:hypothetical protein